MTSEVIEGHMILKSFYLKVPSISYLFHIWSYKNFIIKTQIFHNIKFDLKGHWRSLFNFVFKIWSYQNLLWILEKNTLGVWFCFDCICRCIIVVWVGGGRIRLSSVQVRVGFPGVLVDPRAVQLRTTFQPGTKK